jgi:hypothetical protein
LDRLILVVSLDLIKAIVDIIYTRERAGLGVGVASKHLLSFKYGINFTTNRTQLFQNGLLPRLCKPDPFTYLGLEIRIPLIKVLLTLVQTIHQNVAGLLVLKKAIV